MKKKIISTGLAFALSFAMLISPAQSFAAENSNDAARNNTLTLEQNFGDIKAESLDTEQSIMIQDALAKFEEKGLEISNELSPMTESADIKVVDITEVEESENGNEGGYIGIAPTVANNFSWNSSTVPFAPSSMQATTDIDIVWNKFVAGNFNTNYDFWGTGIGSMHPNNLYSTQSASDYTNYVNQGHVNDYLGAYGQPHTYVAVTSNGYNTMTFLNSYKVRTVVVSTNGTTSFDSGYGTSGNYCKPAAGGSATAFSQSSTTAFNSSKDVFYLTLQPGTYYVIFMPYNNYPVTENNVDTLDNSYHYAFYTGRPLPTQKTYSSVAHSGSVSWNGIAGSSATSATQQLTLSSDSASAPFYAVKGVRFKDNKSIGSGDYLYVSSVDYQYASPNSSMFKTVSGQQGGEFTDYSPSTGSIIGLWQFKYNVRWSNNLAYVGASFYAVTTVYIDYLVPFGSTY